MAHSRAGDAGQTSVKRRQTDSHEQAPAALSQFAKSQLFCRIVAALLFAGEAGLDIQQLRKHASEILLRQGEPA